MEKAQLKRLLEALFLVASEPLSQSRLKEICQVEEGLEEALEELEAEYAAKGFVLRKIAGGWQFFSVPEFLPYVERLYRPKMQKLSKAGLETLAIIAYKQPITRLEMESIRQVNVDGVVNTLLEKNLIKEVGRRDSPGRPILYGTSREFLSFFGLDSLEQLPSLEEMPLPEAEEASPLTEGEEFHGDPIHQ